MVLKYCILFLSALLSTAILESSFLQRSQSWKLLWKSVLPCILGIHMWRCDLNCTSLKSTKFPHKMFKSISVLKLCFHEHWTFVWKYPEKHRSLCLAPDIQNIVCTELLYMGVSILTWPYAGSHEIRLYHYSLEPSKTITQEAWILHLVMNWQIAAETEICFPRSLGRS